MLKPKRDKRGRIVCTCGGYHFPHRKGGGACDHSRNVVYHYAKRQGMDDMDALVFQAEQEGRACSLPPF